MNYIYTGIGSRATPIEILRLMEALGRNLALRGWTLRSGGADGADTAFEEGAVAAQGKKEIYLPWRRFNGRDGDDFFWSYDKEIHERAEEIAGSVHPAWSACNHAARKLHTRNVYQVLGQTLDKPSSFIAFWTPEANTSGTNQALRVGALHNVPSFNLRELHAKDELAEFLKVSTEDLFKDLR